MTLHADSDCYTQIVTFIVAANNAPV